MNGLVIHRRAGEAIELRYGRAVVLCTVEAVVGGRVSLRFTDGPIRILRAELLAREEDTDGRARTGSGGSHGGDGSSGCRGR